MRIGAFAVCVLLGCGSATGGGGGDKCQAVTCTNHGTCSTTSGVASCACATGYVTAEGDRLSCVPDRNASGCGGLCCTGGQQGYCSQSPCGTTADKRDCCILVGGDWTCVN